MLNRKFQLTLIMGPYKFTFKQASGTSPYTRSQKRQLKNRLDAISNLTWSRIDTLLVVGRLSGTMLGNRVVKREVRTVLNQALVMHMQLPCGEYDELILSGVANYLAAALDKDEQVNTDPVAHFPGQLAYDALFDRLVTRATLTTNYVSIEVRVPAGDPYVGGELQPALVANGNDADLSVTMKYGKGRQSTRASFVSDDHLVCVRAKWVHASRPQSVLDDIVQEVLRNINTLNRMQLNFRRDRRPGPSAGRIDQGGASFGSTLPEG